MISIDKYVCMMSLYEHCKDNGGVIGIGIRMGMKEIHIHTFEDLKDLATRIGTKIEIEETEIEKFPTSYFFYYANIKFFTLTERVKNAINDS